MSFSTGFQAWGEGASSDHMEAANKKGLTQEGATLRSDLGRSRRGRRCRGRRCRGRNYRARSYRIRSDKGKSDHESDQEIRSIRHRAEHSTSRKGSSQDMMVDSRALRHCMCRARCKYLTSLVDSIFGLLDSYCLIRGSDRRRDS